MTILNVLGWIVFGGIIGAVARFLMPGKQNIGLALTVGLGIIGSFAGGLLGSLVWRGDGGFVQAGGWITSIVGALIVLFAYTRFVAK